MESQVTQFERTHYPPWAGLPGTVFKDAEEFADFNNPWAPYEQESEQVKGRLKEATERFGALADAVIKVLPIDSVVLHDYGGDIEERAARYRISHPQRGSVDIHREG